ncbi:hypothetical protein ACROYT_G022364 [Oculina patagonica]
MRAVSSWKDHPDIRQKLQSRQRRTKSPKTGREGKTHKPDASHLAITSAAFPYRLPRAMFRGEASNRVGRNDRLGSGMITRSPGKVEEDKRKGEEGSKEERGVAKDRVGRNDRLSQGGGGEAERRKVQTKTEAAGDRKQVGGCEMLGGSGSKPSSSMGRCVERQVFGGSWTPLAVPVVSWHEGDGGSWDAQLRFVVAETELRMGWTDFSSFSLCRALINSTLRKRMLPQKKGMRTRWDNRLYPFRRVELAGAWARSQRTALFIKEERG